MSRRQMLRQASYKLAQQQQILPPLPIVGSEMLDDRGGLAGVEAWANLPTTLAAVCHISDLAAAAAAAAASGSQTGSSQQSQQPPPPPPLPSVTVSGGWHPQQQPSWQQASSAGSYMAPGLPWQPLTSITSPMQPVLELTEHMESL